MSDILLLMEHRGNRRLLVEALSPHHNVILPESDAALDASFDLCVVDGFSLDRLWERILARKQAEQPTFLPFLLVTARQDVGMVTRHLWKSVDELIISPIEKVEFQVRVKSLLEQRQLSLDFHRALVHGSPLAVIALKLDGAITEWNPAAERVFGWSRGEALGRPLFELTAAEQTDVSRQLLEPLQRGEPVTTVESRWQKKDGSIIDVAISAAFLPDTRGGVAHIVCLVSDIAERKRAEERLRASQAETARLLAAAEHSREALLSVVEDQQEAEQAVRQLNESLERRVAERTADLAAANRELEAFSYSVSHDMRAPLRAIDGFSRKVVEHSGARLDDEGRRQLQVVRDSAQRMGQLIDDLLAFSRMSRMDMVLQPVDMAAMARAVAAELGAAEPERTIEFVFSPMPAAHGDAAMLRQVWVNLLGNAVKFTRGRTPARIEVGGRIEGPRVLFLVRDNGAGFDMRYAEKLFGVFQRLHRQDEFEGTGVGLAIAQRILHRHAGHIRGEGKPDGGATFSFDLPLAGPNQQTSGRTAP